MPTITKVWRRVTLVAEWGSLAPTSSPCYKAMSIVKKHLAGDGLGSPTLALCQLPHSSPCLRILPPLQGW